MAQPTISSQILFEDTTVQIVEDTLTHPPETIEVEPARTVDNGDGTTTQVAAVTIDVPQRVGRRTRRIDKAGSSPVNEDALRTSLLALRQDLRTRKTAAKTNVEDAARTLKGTVNGNMTQQQARTVCDILIAVGQELQEIDRSILNVDKMLLGDFTTGAE